MRFNHDGVISEITSMPGCSQICIFHGVFLSPERRGQGLGKQAHLSRLNEARNLGYQMAICTVISSNTRQKQILTDFGWTFHNWFLSDKTENKVELWSKTL